MKQLRASFLPDVNKASTIEEVSTLLDKLDKILIQNVPWPITFSYKPDVSFAIAHADDCVLLKYFVTEEFSKAIYHKTNDPVYKDSCVEFFIAFKGEETYYNFEFNSIGTCLAGFATGGNIKYLPDAVIAKIKTLVLVKTNNHSSDTAMNWELTLIIPLEVFCYNNLVSLKGQECFVNFYKCGDDLPKPHFLAWNNIQFPEPNFHLPEFFGEMQFEENELNTVNNIA